MNAIPNQVSYSGASTLNECERKYCYKYLARIDKDRDYVSPDYFSLGQAFHKVLELTNHKHSLFSGINFRGVVESFKLDYASEGARIAAMLRKYWMLHNAVGLDVVACEIKFAGTYTNGIIDAVMVDAEGNWWIVDLKTAGRLEENLPARIKLDPQLNLYAAFRVAAAEQAKVDPDKFAGVRYRETSKPGQVYKAGETFESYTQRCDAGVKCREIVIPANEIDSKASYLEFCKNIERAHAMQNEFNSTKTFVGRCNFKACLAWGRPCEYFSACYGKSYTETMSSTRVITTAEVGGKTVIVDAAAIRSDVEKAAAIAEAVKPSPVPAPVADTSFLDEFSTFAEDEFV
jgi:hypothetical protein